MQMKFVVQGPYGVNVGSRTYLMSDQNNYMLFGLKNREFSFDVDISNLPCGLNGALYFVEMPKDGGNSNGNKAGAKFGTGYCDAQCPRDIKFIEGEANIIGWTPTNKNSGIGRYGACCTEMDIWEANSMAAAYTPHACSVSKLTRCNGTSCGDGKDRYNGLCDKDGCDFNSWRMGDQNFFGPGKTVQTSRPFTVVTQFITSNGQDSGDLTEIRRHYMQDGKVIPNSQTKIPGMKNLNSITTEFCATQKAAFGDPNDFQRKGGLQAMGRIFDQGMVLVMSIWDDYDAHMLWLDSDYPLTKSPSIPGVSRGPCDTSSGNPPIVERDHPNSSVKFSNIKIGVIH